MKSEAPYRRVVSTKFYQPKNAKIGHGSVGHTLECGHEVFAKKSCGYPAKKRCLWCLWEGSSGRAPE